MPITLKELIEMLEQDLEVEKHVIKRYQTRVEQADFLKEFAMAQQLREILAMEKDHAMDLRLVLGD